MIIKTKNIGQETGVYDKYGIPIKIGHIVTWHSGDPKISSEVGYVHTNGEEIWFQYGDNKWSCTTEAVLTDMPPEQLEVIGDVVNNLDLLTWMKECPNQLAWAKQDQQEEVSEWMQQLGFYDNTDAEIPNFRYGLGLLEKNPNPLIKIVEDEFPDWDWVDDITLISPQMAMLFYLAALDMVLEKTGNKNVA